jgi:cellulose synthase operon protein C
VSEGQGDALMARQQMGEALRLNPASLPVRLEMARLLIRTNGAGSALKILDDAPADQKGAIAVLVERNWALMASGDMSTARKGIDAGLAAKLQSPELLFQDGVWKLQKGDIAAARVSLDRVLNANPQSLPGLNAIYASYTAQHQGAAGAKKIQQYAGKVPHSAAVQGFLGQVLMANGEYGAARTAFTSALAANPQMREARMGLIRLDIKENKPEAAAEKLTTALAANPKDVSARLWLANVDEMKGDHASAFANYQQVVQSDPKNPEALNNLAYLLVDYKKQPDTALQYAQKAQELAPNNPDYADTVGWVFYQKGLYSLAVKNFESAASNPAAGPVCKYHLAMAYAKVGQRDRGRVALSAALKRDPRLPEANAATQLLAQ